MKGKILDQLGHFIAEVEVVLGSAGIYEGYVERLSSDEKILELFSRYQAAVNGQMLVEVDHLEQEIADLEPALETQLGETARLSNLQIYPDELLVSFQFL